LKRIPLNLPLDDTSQRPRDVLKEIVQFSPNKPLSVNEIRQRVTIVEALDRATDEVLLEDATHKVLAEALESFPYNRASRDLLTVIDAVLGAHSVDVTELASAKDKQKGAEKRRSDG
jgi:hypothetical protein